MRLTDEWDTMLSTTAEGQSIVINVRLQLEGFQNSGKFKERVEIVWRYESEDGMPCDELAGQMEAAQEIIQRKMEKDKLAILTGIYTGGGERCWVFYTRKTEVFCQYLTEALAEHPLLPIVLEAEEDPEWGEYCELLS